MRACHEQSLMPDPVPGKSAKRIPLLFNIFTIIALLIPFPLMLFWLGVSMILYILNRHHPVPEVSRYVKQAALRLYAVAVFALPLWMLYPLNTLPWFIYWAIAALILIPWSIYDLIKINRDSWDDAQTKREESDV